VVHVSKEPFLLDSGIASLNLNGCEVRWVPNHGPLRKAVPILATLSNDDILVTVDDDVMYPRNWLHKLLVHHEQCEAVVCGRGRRIVAGQPYCRYPVIQRCHAVGRDIIPTGRNGVVYRRKWMNPSVFDIEKYLQICPLADDLWLYANRKVDVPTMVVPVGRLPQISNRRRLGKINVRRGENDRSIERLKSHGYQFNPDLSPDLDTARDEP
jgi:hypothetical protein